MQQRVDVIVHISRERGVIKGYVQAMGSDTYSSMGEIMEDAKKRGHLSITTPEGVIAVNIDHIVMLRAG